jgi:hypothetical protein
MPAGMAPLILAAAGYAVTRALGWIIARIFGEVSKIQTETLPQHGPEQPLPLPEQVLEQLRVAI